MPLKAFDTNKLSALISVHVDQVTCIECRKYYIVPTTASCGHTLCHACWRWRKACVYCGTQVDRKALKLNLHLQNQTEHAHTLAEEFERIFKVKLDEFILDAPVAKESIDDPTKNVKEWLASSENQFSAPQASQQSVQDVKIQSHDVSNKANVHTETPKLAPNKNTVYVRISQDDWDKIEELPDTEEVCKKSSDNPVGPMDIEPFVADQIEFTADNPRRSVRKKDVKGNNTTPKADNNFVDKNSTKNSSDTESKTVKSKQNWGNVKRMKKEFSKLNKKRNNKLNVSIEMCKKTQSSANKNMVLMPPINNSDDMIINIDENSPVVNNNLNGRTESESNLENNENNIQLKHTLSNLQPGLEVHKDREDRTPEINQNINQPTEKRTFSESRQSEHSNACTKKNEVTPVPFIMKGALLTPSSEENLDRNKSCNNNNLECITVHTDNVTKSTDDIEITIKIGNTLTNICIKKKEKDVQLKINTDREVQTTQDKCTLENKKNVCCSPIKEIDPGNNVIINIQNNKCNTSQQIVEECGNKKILTVKTPSTNKNTESADTATVQYEITASIEKELSKEMEKTNTQKTCTISKSGGKIDEYKPDAENDALGEDDFDFLENESIKEGNVQLLKSTNQAPSEILMSTVKSAKSKKQTGKRGRDTDSDDLSVSKKMKINAVINNDSEDIGTTQKKDQSKNIDEDSELTNYDAIMGQVFANIDADMEDLQNKSAEKNNSQLEKTTKHLASPLKSTATPNPSNAALGVSENVFSILEKENETGDIVNLKDQSQTLGRQTTQTARKTQVTENDVELMEQELSTPVQNNDGSDESVVEETPQKTESFLKAKQSIDSTLRRQNSFKLKSLQLKKTRVSEEENAQNKTVNTPKMSVIDISDITDDTTRNSKHVTIIEAEKPRPTLDTPLTISKFVDQIKHKSTPVARKSLNFDKENTENCEADADQTLCPNSFLVARTTQEREFMCNAFEDSPNSAKSPLTIRNLKMRTIKYCVAGTCLTPFEIKNLKLLCTLRNWDYVDKYTKELTHLVVGVDEERKSQRSVKYMCALAASKWIVSYEWVKKCLHMKKVVDEELFEALDSTGEPGPRRSRVAKQKLFQGITFFCMPPFSVLDVDTLKEMLEAAGGRVVEEAKAVRVTGSTPALLLAEPEHTQEDRFIYLAMELGIVPVNYEWVLNCLGSYTISSVQELLLCPASLLPPATAQWPQALIARDYD
ncbi:uncharacterized protein [Epargyreus clarus]|uniref:uncharacterized protein n=1 Tax=Epargyreus clarus TaxID=520877 RepID=UPI003C2BA4F7